MKVLQKFFQAIKAILLSRLFLYLIGMVVAAVIIWFIGALTGDRTPLGQKIIRMLVITLIPAVLGLGAVFSSAGQRRKNRDLQNQLSQTPEQKAASAAATSAKEEMSEVSVKLKDALELLKKSKVRRSFGNGWLYEMPWYVFVGPPGSGKTTALTNSGLNFPLSDHLGKKAVKGVGGTRSCDWWFTDEAVLIDTAGRYTTQDSDEKADAGAWKGFLKLLKKHRSRQPINGAIVTIGLSDLLEANDETRTAHARAIKARLKELHDELNVPFNVYVLFSKADRIEGFVEFFDDLGKEEREQVWGVTFDSAENREGAVVNKYAGEFDALIERLSARQMERLQKETDIERRGEIFSFPQQIASLKELTDSFLKEIFEPNRFEKMPPLRGVYFASGVQHGAPINRLLGAMSATFGLKLAKSGAATGGGRSYFLSHLLRKVIFAEANMVKSDSLWEKRNKRVRYAVLGTAGATVLGVSGLWLWALLENNALVAQVREATSAYDQALEESGADAAVIEDDELRPVLPHLNDLKNLPGGYAETGGKSPVIASFGLFQGGKIKNAASAAYERGLDAMFLPRVLLNLENRMRSLLAQRVAADIDSSTIDAATGELHDALKAYLILHGQAPDAKKPDTEAVRAILSRLWKAHYGGEDATEPISRAEHLDALLQFGVDRNLVEADGGLVDEAREVLQNHAPDDALVYQTLKNFENVAKLEQWTVARKVGGADKVFARQSGKMLSEGVPGLLTYKGFHEYFIPNLPKAIELQNKDRWVRYREPPTDQTVDTLRLRREVTERYVEDFKLAWSGLLDDLALVDVDVAERKKTVLIVLSNPASSPLKELMSKAARETRLSAPYKKEEAARGTNEVAEAAADVSKKEAEKLCLKQARTAIAKAACKEGSRAVGGGAEAAMVELDIAGPATDRFFEDLFLASEANGPIDAFVLALSGVRQAMGSGGAGNPGAIALALEELQAASAAMPQPTEGSGAVQAIAAAIETAVSAQASASQSAGVNKRWKDEVYGDCKTIAGRFPYSMGASSDMKLKDFARVLDKMEQFNQTHIEPVADQFTEGTKERFKRAREVKEMFFPEGGATPSVEFQLTGRTLAGGATKATLKVGDAATTLDTGPPESRNIVWTGRGKARIEFSPAKAGQENVLDGGTDDWAFFRLLKKAQMRPDGDLAYVATFRLPDGRSAAFEIKAASRNHPFGGSPLRGFSCPAQLAQN